MRGQMFTVVFGAVRSRTPQALMVLILAALPAVAAAAAPWYGLAVGSRAAAADVAVAPAVQRVLSTSRPGALNGDPRGALADFGDTLRTLLPLAGATPVLGLRQPMIYSPQSGRGAASRFAAAYRDGFCSHVRLTGACPAAAGDAAISRDVARRIPLAVGDEFLVRATAFNAPVRFRVVGLYDLLDPAGPYWSAKLYGANGELDPFFTTLDSFRAPELGKPTFGGDLEVPASLLRGDDGYNLSAVLRAAVPRLTAERISLSDQTGPLLDTVRRDRATILRGVLVALGQLIVLGWFAVALAGRYTSRDRRSDAGLLKLRGNTRFSMLRLALGQHLVPLFGAAVAGLPIGFLAAWLLAGRLPVASEVGPALLLSAAGVAAVLLGGLVVLAAVDAAVLRLPVATLLLRFASRRRGWRGDVADLAVLAVAAFAVYQARSSGPDSGLGIVAPALVALALALLLARALRWFADRAGAGAVRRGRLRFGLTAVQVSRQPGTDRVFALIVVAVAMFALAVGGVAAGREARADRSEIELGATRVLTVQATTRTQLEYAVRAADPAGRQAMAAVVDLGTNPPVLAVDSARLAAVASWRPEYGAETALTGATAAARLPAALPPITGTSLTLRVGSDRGVAAPLYAILQNEATGAPVRVTFEVPGRGEQTVSAPVAGCDTGPGCRLVRWQLVTPPGPDGESVAGTVTLKSLAQQDPPGQILGAAELADATRWYTDFRGVALAVSTTRSGLTMVPESREGLVPGDKVYVTDAPLPLPIVLAGAQPADWHFDDASSYRFGPNQTPVQVVGTADVLPVLGVEGVMVDLDATRRIAADAEMGGTFQVWLAPDAPPSIVDRLGTAGLKVVADDSTAVRAAQLAQQGRSVTARFGLFTVALGLLLAAVLVAVAAAVEREPYLAQLRALRVQGLPRRTAEVAGSAGTAGLIVTGLIGGVAAALVARPIAGVLPPPFADGWRVIPPPPALGAGALALAALIALAALAVAAALAVLPLLRRLRGTGPRGGAR